MMTVNLHERLGSFANNKDKAKDIRLNLVIPSLEKGDEVILDFSGVEDATQSFVHALISDLFRKYGADVLDRIKFKGCSETVEKIISIVANYMQESLR
jgi:hypothetical protein